MEFICQGCPFREWMYEDTGELSMSHCYCHKHHKVVTEECEEIKGELHEICDK